MPSLPNGDLVFLTVRTASTNAFFSAAVMSLTSLRTAIAPVAGAAHAARATKAASSGFHIGAKVVSAHDGGDRSGQRRGDRGVGRPALRRVREVPPPAGRQPGAARDRGAASPPAGPGQPRR